MSHRRTDPPAPTIVGPRPQGAAGGSIAVPDGLERLLAVAAAQADWKRKVLADPVGAAEAAGIALSASERAILKSMPPSALERLIAPFAGRASALGGVKAAGLAAAALLSTVFNAEGTPPAPTGIRPDVPPSPAAPAPTDAKPAGIRPDVPPGPEAPRPADEARAPSASGVESLDTALAAAAKTGQAVMAVFLIPDPAREGGAIAAGGVRADEPKVKQSNQSRQMLSARDAEIRNAAQNAKLLVAKVAPPAATGKDAEAKWAAYQALLRKHELHDQLPTVLFLAPDGSALSKHVRPTDPKALGEAIKAVPPLLARWKANSQAAPETTSPAAKGGARSDIPQDKQQQ
jgi:hypothetical protein